MRDTADGREGKGYAAVCLLKTREVEGAKEGGGGDGGFCSKKAQNPLHPSGEESFINPRLADRCSKRRTRRGRFVSVDIDSPLDVNLAAAE